MNQGQGEAAAPSPDPIERRESLPAAFMPKPDLVVVPSTEQFQLVRAEAKETGRTQELHRMVAAWQAAASKCHLAFEELVRLAVFRLQVERDLGTHLAQTVRHGGDRARSSRSILLEDGGLPNYVSPNQSAAYQALAAIPEDVFQGYVETARGKRKIPSSRGARAFAEPRKSAAARAKKPSTASVSSRALSPQLIDACVRCLGDINVLVGKAKVKAALTIEAKGDLTKKARGKVLVVEAPFSEASLRSVTKLRIGGVIEEAIVVLPREINPAWFPVFGDGQWAICFPSDPGSPIVAHIGSHARGFSLVFSEVGVVMVAQPSVLADRP